MSYPPPPPFDPNQPNQNDPAAPYQPPQPHQPPAGQEPPTMPYGQPVPPQSVPPAPSPYDPQSAPPPPYPGHQAYEPPPSYQPGQATPSYGPPPGYPPPPDYAGHPGYPPGYPPAPGMLGEPPKKSKAPLIIGIVIGVVLLLCVGCGGVGYYVYNRAQETVNSLPTARPTVDLPNQDPTDPQTSSGPDTGTGKTVTYEVTGTGEATVTYTGSSGHVEQEKVTLPWTKQVTAADNFFLANVLVLQTGDDKALSCKVSADGKELRSRSGKGVVSCTGIVE